MLDGVLLVVLRLFVKLILGMLIIMIFIVIGIFIKMFFNGSFLIDILNIYLGVLLLNVVDSLGFIMFIVFIIYIFWIVGFYGVNIVFFFIEIIFMKLGGENVVLV